MACCCGTSLVGASLAACASSTSVGPPSLPSSAELDRRIDRIAKTNAVTGLGVALIRNGEPVYLHTVGTRDVDHALPLTPDTVMYGASLTKAVFAVFVMQLVEEHQVDLDASIAVLLPRPLPEHPRYADLVDDPRWRQLTLRRLLDHTSGFANFRWMEADRKLRLHRDPGTRFGYSGEGIQLAQFVIEQRLGIDSGEEIRRRIFDRLGMSRSSLVWRDDFAADVAHPSSIDGTVLPHRHRSRTDAPDRWTRRSTTWRSSPRRWCAATS